MPRTYVKGLGTRPYANYSKEVLERAIKAVKNGMTCREASRRVNIPKSTINRKVLKKQCRPYGAPTTLTEIEENAIVRAILTCSEWGFPLDIFDVRCVVKSYLDKQGRKIRHFANNLPGVDWASLFLRRHKAEISQRISANIKRNRAKVSPEVINDYFDQLEEAVSGVPAENIVNYDETNLTDDPGRKKCIVKRGMRYPERVMNYSKAATSIMFAGSAHGEVLPVYVVYRSEHMWDTWTLGGPNKCRYNRTKSGWFDARCFEDWFFKVALPYLKHKHGKKVLIGDNLSSHMSLDVIYACEEHNIHFVCLPANATHIAQPLDVAFFRPLKTHWRKVLTEWKITRGRSQATVPKDHFPTLLSKLMNAIKPKQDANLRAGFEKCGITPLRRKKVLERLPKTRQELAVEETVSQDMDNSLITILKDLRYGHEGTSQRGRKRVNVVPGKSVKASDFLELEEPESSSEGSTDPDNPTSDNSLDPDAGTSANVQEPVVPKDAALDDYVVVQFDVTGASASRKRRKVFIGQITRLYPDEEEVEIKCLRRSTSEKDPDGVFTWPTVEDSCLVDKNQIVKILAPPSLMRRGKLKFNRADTLYAE